MTRATKAAREAHVEETTDQAIGRRIREAREARGLTQQALSVRSKWMDHEQKGISRTAVIGYESGTSRPGTRELRMLCETLQVTPNHLIFGSEEPFQVLNAAREGMTQHLLGDAVQLAFVLAALKGHERDALVSLTLALAGRQLGDVRLSGLRTTAMLVTPDIEAALKKMAEGDDVAALTLEELVDRVSAGMVSTLGHRLKVDDDGNVVGGEWQYPDPKGKPPSKPSKS